MHADNVDTILLTLTTEIGVIIAVSRLLGLWCRRLRQPQVIGEVVAGILLGPSFFGWIAPRASAAFFPPETMPFLKVLSEYGIVFFMFLIGLELDPALLRERGRAAMAISAVSIVLPFVLGALFAVSAYETLAPPGVATLPFALFIGAAMSITAFPVLARMLIERDLLHTRVGAMTVTCAAVDDLAGWCILALVVALARSEALGGGLAVAVRALAYIGVMAFVVRPVLDRLRALYDTRGGLSQNLLAVVYVLMLASALATQALGIHAVFGGFMFGAIMPKHGGFVRDLTEKTEDFATVFLLPIYFAYTGLRTQIGHLDTPDTWLLALVVIGIAVVGKCAGGAITARAIGFGWREAGALGVLMNTRGLMELIVLNVGLDLGVINPTAFAIMVLMAIVTTLMTTPALALLYPAQELRAEVIGPEAGAAAPPVLVPVALASSGPRLIDVAAGLASGERPRVYALHSARPPERGVLGALPPTEPQRGVFEPLERHASGLGIDFHPIALMSRNPADDIVDVARAKGADLIVMGWHKPVFGRSVLGGTVERVMRRAQAGVAVLVDKDLPATLDRILLPYAGTEHDRFALGLAARLAGRQRAAVTLLHVVRPGHGEAKLDAEARRLVDAVTSGRDGGVRMRVTAVESDDPVTTVVTHAAGHDLAILGVGEEWQVEPTLFGLRTERIATDCPCSLLIVRAPV